MKKKILILCLLTIASFILGAAPVMADTAAPAQFSNEQIKLAQLNWNAYLEAAKTNPAALPTVYGQITSVYPDSVIGQAAIINHFGPAYPATNTTMALNDPYFNCYKYYWCTYQYR